MRDAISSKKKLRLGLGGRRELWRKETGNAVAKQITQKLGGKWRGRKEKFGNLVAQGRRLCLRFPDGKPMLTRSEATLIKINNWITRSRKNSLLILPHSAVGSVLSGLQLPLPPSSSLESRPSSTRAVYISVSRHLDNDSALILLRRYYFQMEIGKGAAVVSVCARGDISIIRS